MSWDKNEEEAFPARHPREPGGLRQDILDEIADHLACAAAHERERDNEGTEESIWDRVLERFGNPDAIARRLWWDQMKEIVMREWIQTGVMIVVGLAVVVFMALMVRQVGTANQAVLEALRGGSGAETSLVTLQVKVTRGAEVGAPAEGVAVSVRGAAFGGEETSIERITDATGMATFGPMQPGKFRVFLRDPYSGMGAEARETTLFAGENDTVLTIAAPANAPRELALEFDRPVVLSEDNFLHLQVNTYADVAGTEWESFQDGWLNKDGLWGRDPDITDEQEPSRMGRDGNRYVDGVDWADYQAERYPFMVSGEPQTIYVSVLRRSDESIFCEVDDKKLSDTDITAATPEGAYVAAMPPEVAQQLALWQMEDHAAARGIELDSDLWDVIRKEYPDMLVDSATLVAETRTGIRLNDRLYAADHPQEYPTLTCAAQRRVDGRNIEAPYNAVIAAHPDFADVRDTSARVCLAVYGELHLNEFENELEVIPATESLLSDPWEPIGKAGNDATAPVVLDQVLGTPITLSPDSIGHRNDNAWRIIDVTEAYLADKEQPPGAFLLRWSREDLVSSTRLAFVGAHATALQDEHRRPLWLVLTPMKGPSGTASQQAPEAGDGSQTTGTASQQTPETGHNSDLSNG